MSNTPVPLPAVLSLEGTSTTATINQPDGAATEQLEGESRQPTFTLAATCTLFTMPYSFLEKLVYKSVLDKALFDQVIERLARVFQAQVKEEEDRLRGELR